MILFSTLLTILLVIATILFIVTGVIGTISLGLFGDVIVFVLLISLIVKLFRKPKQMKKKV